MSQQTSIRISFHSPKEALQARYLAAVMLAVYRHGGRRFLPFEGMELQDAGGFRYYERRSVRYEEAAELRGMGDTYLRKYKSFLRSLEATEDPYGGMRLEGCLLEMCGADIPHACQISGYYFEDLFAMLCMILAATAPDDPFEGMCRTVTDGHTKRILTQAVYDGKVLIFVQMEGSPVYDAEVLTWTVTEGRFEKNSYECPCICVKLLADQKALMRDPELAEWIKQTNAAESEMISAELRCMCGNYTDVRLFAGRRDVCVKYRDALLALLAEKGLAAKVFGFLEKNEFRGPHVVIPSSVTIIGNKAFRGQSGLKSILISDSVTSIGSFAFEDCVSLETIHIPDSVTEIGNFAFSSCWSLRAVTLPGKLKVISCGMFCCCGELREITIPGSVLLIDNYAFSGCGSLTSVVIPDGVRWIKDEVFHDCTGLESVVIPESVTDIGKALFKDGNPGMIIRGKKGSAAARWATDNGFRFEEM